MVIADGFFDGANFSGEDTNLSRSQWSSRDSEREPAGHRPAAIEPIEPIEPIGPVHAASFHEALKADPARWAALAHAGEMLIEAEDSESGKVERLELRNCGCGATLSIVIGGAA